MSAVLACLRAIGLLPMYLRRVVLQDIKGFGTVDLSLGQEGAYSGWTVVTGDNGSGKTALLRAISLAILGPEQARGLIPDFRQWVTQGRNEGTISLEIRPDHDYDKTLRGGFPSNSLWAEVGISEEHDVGSVFSADVYRNKKKGAVNGPWSPATQGWFTVGYGPFRRFYGTSPEAQRLMVIPGRMPRFATLFKEDATLGEGEQWIRTLHYKKLESGDNYQTKILDQLLALIGDDFLRFGAKVDHVGSDGVWLKDARGRIIALADLSEGYRAALAMLIDIFRHMVEVYGPDIIDERKSPSPSSVDNELGLVPVEFQPISGASIYVDRPGVVLIDEVDAHFHPEWQRQIGFWLKEHFPKVQFIVTTHSPLVCQAADNGRIFHMPAGQDSPPFRVTSDDFQRIIASRPDDILISAAFGLRHTWSPLAVRKRTRHSVLHSKSLSQTGLTVDEKNEFDQLSFFINQGN
jgi:putative AbiEii toxin of type IV toxin-antitoxin system/AAA domain-containing protein